MTKQDAIRLLRTENLGDSEQMELAKKMGADALERQQLHFIAPVCEKCGQVVTGVEIEYFASYYNVAAMKNIRPAHCPRCFMLFDRVDINYKEQTCILKGPRDLTHLFPAEEVLP